VVTINSTPSAFTVSPALTTVCGEDSVSWSLSPAPTLLAGTYKIGTGTLGSSTATPFRGFYGGGRSQSLYTAAELTAAGLVPGQAILNIGEIVTAFTGPYTFNDFNIKLKNTTATSLTSTNGWETGLTSVFGPAPFTMPGNAVPFTVTHNLETPFVWDGTNLLVEMCFNNNDGGGPVSGNSASLQYTTVTNSALYYYADNLADMCSNSSFYGPTSTRTNHIFGVGATVSEPIVWSPSTGITVAANGLSAKASPGAGSTTYTVTASNGSCNRSNTATIIQNPKPSGVSLVGGTATCQNSTAPQLTFTASVGTAPYTFSYKINGGATQTVTTSAGPNPRSVTVNVPTSTAGDFTYTLTGVADIYCTNTIADSQKVTVNALPTVSYTGFSGSSYCLSESATLTANQAAGTFSGAGITSNGDGTANWSASTAGAGTHTITYSYTDANGCTNTTTQSVTVNPNVSAGTLAAGSTCVGTSAQMVLTGATAGGVYTISDEAIALVNAASGVVTGVAGGTATITYTLGTGCGAPVSSSAIVTVNTATSSTVNETACNTFTYGGTTYTASGTYSKTLVNAAGCDSLVTLNLTINSSSASSSSFTACDSYLWNGTTYTTSGVKTFTTTNAAGCDSVVTLNLTINNSTTSTTSQTACNSFTWNGTAYTASGTYTWSGTNAAGCDSTATLNLTINASSTNTVTESACNSFTFNGTTYTVGGEYSWTGSNAVGCDSVVTLILTINSPSSSTDTVSACTSYTWNGNTYTTSGNYSFNATNAAGCDSVANLVLTINTCNTTLNVNAFLEGFYTGSNTMSSSLFDQGISIDATATDTITVNLYASTPSVSATADYSVKVILHNDGTATAIFPGATLGNSYYVALKHRNHLETWSASPITFGATNSMNFTNSASAAYSDGVNAPLKSVAGGKFALYAGDVNQDGTIDLFDLSDTENDASNFISGYNASDVNGDSVSDLFDLSLIENNSTLFIFVARP
jgi:hypothetical protein